MVIKHDYADRFDGFKTNRLVFMAGGAPAAPAPEPETTQEAEPMVAKGTPEAPETPEEFTAEAEAKQAEGSKALKLASANLTEIGVTGRSPDTEGSGKAPRMPEGPKGNTSQAEIDQYVARVAGETQTTEVAEATEAATETPDAAADRILSDTAGLEAFLKQTGDVWQDNNTLFAETFGVEDPVSVIKKIQERSGLLGDAVDGKWGTTTNAFVDGVFIAPPERKIPEAFPGRREA